MDAAASQNSHHPEPDRREDASFPSSSSSPPPSSRVEEEEEEEDEEERDRRSNGDNFAEQQRMRSSRTFTYHVNLLVSDVAASEVKDDIWSALAVLITFWFFASMTLILGFYGSGNLQLGPNCSRLIQTNPFFVQSIKVINCISSCNSHLVKNRRAAQELDEQKPGPVLHGFHKPPPLDVETAWTETKDTLAWIYFLNKGSSIDIIYRVMPTSSSPLTLVIAQGSESLAEWIEDPSYGNATLSWNIIYASGRIQQEIPKSSTYYIAVGNLNPENVEVELVFNIKSILYNTTKAYYKCSLYNRLCSLKLSLFRANVAVITSPGPEEGVPDNDWYVSLSYGPRWAMYFLVAGYFLILIILHILLVTLEKKSFSLHLPLCLLVGVMTLLLLTAFKIYYKFQNSSEDTTEFQAEEEESEQTPLLPPKDDDVLSWGSSYESVSNTEEDLDECLAASSLEGGLTSEADSNNTRRLCVICFDGPRDCFFLPCGHCAVCFTCGTRIAEEAGTCPICRRRMKKVRKIFTMSLWFQLILVFGMNLLRRFADVITAHPVHFPVYCAEGGPPSSVFSREKTEKAWTTNRHNAAAPPPPHRIMAPRSAGPSHIFPSVIALSLLSLGFVIYKVNDFATQTKTLTVHNLEPTPWHFFPPKTFTDETLHDRAYKLIHCSYLACRYKSNEVPERRRPPSSLAKAPKCPEFFRSIHHDLEPWARTRISAAHLETAKQYAAFRVVIVDGRLYVDLYWACVQSRAMFTIWGFLQLLARYPGRVPDHQSMPLPVFRYCTDGDHFDIPFPDWSFWVYDYCTGQSLTFIPGKSSSQKSKVGKRRSLLHIGKETQMLVPPFVQSYLTATTRRCGVRRLCDWEAEARAGYEQSKLSKQCNHLYKIYAEGYAWSVSLKYMVSCGSLTLIIRPQYEDFLSRGLIPKINYWPISPNAICPSIKSAVDWALGHQSEAKAMGQRGQDFMESLSMDRVYDYMFHLITEYSKLLDFKSDIPASARIPALSC
ncbi:unnamed protein product [Malus baccata var. baccata]